MLWNSIKLTTGSFGCPDRQNFSRSSDCLKIKHIHDFTWRFSLLESTINLGGSYILTWYNRFLFWVYLWLFNSRNLLWWPVTYSWLWFFLLILLIVNLFWELKLIKLSGIEVNSLSYNYFAESLWTRVN